MQRISPQKLYIEFLLTDYSNNEQIVHSQVFYKKEYFYFMTTAVKLL